MMLKFYRIDVLKSVGKLALKTLISNNPLLQKSEIDKIVKDFTFEYGFFAGHDYFLCAHWELCVMKLRTVHRDR